MSRGYTVEQDQLDYATAQGDYAIFYGTWPDERTPRITSVVLDVTSELGDAGEEHLRLQLLHGFTTSASGGFAKTVRPLDPNDAANSSSWLVGMTTCNFSSPSVSVSIGVNVRIGLRAGGWQYGSSDIDSELALKLVAAVADDLQMSGTLTFVEPPYS